MSKKKAATMTLKDFHGGSIPSDLPLPSAPGVSVRPSQERLTTMPARSERARHTSASPAAISPLPAPPRVIGRHFDEDERTPFDAPPRVTAAMPVATGAWAQKKEQSNPSMGLAPTGSGAGPTVWSPSRVAQASAVEKVISGRWHSNSSSRSDQLVPPVSELEMRPTGTVGFGSGDSCAPGFGLGQRPVANSSFISENRIESPVEQNQVGSGPGSSFDIKVPERTVTVGSGHADVRFYGIGSDLRQVERTGIIGENQVRSLADEPQVKRVGLGSEVNRPERTHIVAAGFDDAYGYGSGFVLNQRPVARSGIIGENRVRSPIGLTDMRRVGSGSGSEDIHGIGSNWKAKNNNWEERPRSVGLMDRKEKTGLAVDSEVKAIERPASHEGRFVAGPTDRKEGAERPRLKLLPRTKPIESQEMRLSEEKMGYELYSSSTVSVGNDMHEMNGDENMKAKKGGNTMVDSATHQNERPRLNLKPRSQLVGGQSEKTTGKERKAVFGGARPRELVLKERGVEISDDLEKNTPSNRPNSSSAKPDTKPEPGLIKPVGNRPESYQSQQRNIQHPHNNQKEHHHTRHQHQADTQRATWRDNTHNNTNSRRAPHQNQHQQSPRPDPDTWRKPEPAKQDDVSEPRPGKGATALELAEAFSKRGKVLDGKRDPVSKNPNSVVFSRLVGGERDLYNGPPPQKQINGY